ncbi:Protein kinase C substrate, 80 KD protein, heavy chain [Plasmopara halstedii]|uniref:Glucosidase 2 subunit beta n=1 Tax=Plasmopara halstedii TaxID=4781 RepID=A0A0P1AJ84_PLAHL|nr:Protein kinase C substrate, 80 KD protein, heavy chain [Plasmopara halstedii]CEG41134.1 Protein kinase C substrate, 80 KD protein, heavy chain [Plasmopara halstedii]|eukprot:XP_024577503.1 Protein kinase C substrate, 80 KD protein, heavy chain [Plasmopara halstedii]
MSTRARISLFACLAAVIVSIGCMPMLSNQVLSVAASLSAYRIGNHHKPSEALNDDDVDDEVEGEWDFMDNDAIFGLPKRQDEEENVDTEDKNKSCVTITPVEFVNDDYCDCHDGSDEPITSACSNLLLHLKTSMISRELKCKAGDKMVALAFVDDGVCDCCDGSDEKDGLCIDTCETEWVQQLELLHKRLDIVVRGQKNQAEYITKAADKVQQLQTDFEHLSRYFQSETKKFEALQRRSKHNPTLSRQVEQSYDELRQVQYTTYVQSRVTDQSTFLDAKWKLAFVELVGLCFSYTVNEKELKGGGSYVIPRKYDMIFCPFQNISQTEPWYSSWKKAEHQTKFGAAKMDDVIEKESVPVPIILGVWNQWNNSIGLTRVQDYNHGVPCANGQERRARVKLSCGAQNRVLSVEECAICEYEIQFETPAACEIAELNAVKDKIAQVETFRVKNAVGKTSDGHEEL